MALSISTEALHEKNKTASNDPWLLLLEILYPSENPIRLVWNTEDITWDGETWLAAAFSLGDIEETKEGEIPEVSLDIVDIERRLTPILDQYSGGIGASVIIRVVHSAHLDVTTPEYEDEMEIIDVTIDHQNKIKFKLGAENLSNFRCPPDRFLKGHCRYKEFKGSKCGYDGPETECDRTFERCRELGNQARFGGFPSVGRLGYHR